MCSDLLIDKRVLEDDFKDNFPENFAMCAENYPWRSLLLSKLQ